MRKAPKYSIPTAEWADSKIAGQSEVDRGTAGRPGQGIFATGRRLGGGPILVLFPRCLRKDVRNEAERICSEFDDVVLHIAPGGTEARRIIKDISPGAIVAVA